MEGYRLNNMYVKLIENVLVNDEILALSLKSRMSQRCLSSSILYTSSTFSLKVLDSAIKADMAMRGIQISKECTFSPSLFSFSTAPPPTFGK